MRFQISITKIKIIYHKVKAPFTTKKKSYFKVLTNQISTEGKATI